MEELSGDSNFTMEDINSKNIRYVKTTTDSWKDLVFNNCISKGCGSFKEHIVSDLIFI